MASKDENSILEEKYRRAHYEVNMLKNESHKLVSNLNEANEDRVVFDQLKDEINHLTTKVD